VLAILKQIATFLLGHVESVVIGILTPYLSLLKLLRAIAQFAVVLAIYGGLWRIGWLNVFTASIVTVVVVSMVLYVTSIFPHLFGSMPPPSSSSACAPDFRLAVPTAPTQIMEIWHGRDRLD
jgi:hypothetical protein